MVLVFKRKQGGFAGGVWAEGEVEFLQGNLEYLVGTGASAHGTVTAVADPRTGVPTMKGDLRAAVSALHVKAKYTLSQDIDIPFTDISLGNVNYEQVVYGDLVSVGAKLKYDTSTGKLDKRIWRGAGDIDPSSPKITFDQNEQWFDELQDKFYKWLED